MAYPSLLFLENPVGTVSSALCEDLCLGQALPSIARETHLGDPCGEADLSARQDLFARLEDDAVFAQLSQLRRLTGELCRTDDLYRHAACETERRLLYVALCRGLVDFSHACADCTVGGAYFDRLSQYFAQQLASSRFVSMEEDLSRLVPQLSAHRRFTVSHAPGERENPRVDLSSQVGETFLSRLVTCASHMEVTLPDSTLAKSPDAAILTSLGDLSPDMRISLDAFFDKHKNMYIDSILEYDSQLAFYADLHALCARVRAAGIPMCYPEITQEKQIKLNEAYDISLLFRSVTDIVPNDVTLTEAEPFFFVTGANGGGKTTFLRTVGISSFLCTLGSPVPCRSAQITCLHGVFTHFPSDERFDEDGRFADENRRVEEIFRLCDGNSLLLLNETFSTTTPETAAVSTSALAHRVAESTNFGLYVTHLHAVDSTGLPGLHAEVALDDSNRRTFKIRRTGQSGNSLAADILKKYRLDREQLAIRFCETEVTI